MAFLGMLVSSSYVLTKSVLHLHACDHRTDTAFNIHSPLLPSISAPLALLLLTFSRPYSKPTIQFIHQRLRRRARNLMCCFHLARSLL